MANSFGSITKFLLYKDSLVHGYCKHNMLNIIPLDLIDIVIAFYNDVSKWRVRGTELKMFHNAEINQKLNGPKFKLSKHLEFEVKLNPKDPYGSGPIHTILLACINFDLVPDNIKSIQIYYVLYFKEMELEYRQIDTLRRLSDGYKFTSSEWYAYLCKYNDVKNRNLTQLNFGCYAELLRVNYKNNSIKWFNPLYKMQIECDYMWKFDRDEMKRFKKSAIDYGLYSDNFNSNSFCIVVAPGGITVMKESKGFVMMKIKLLRLPDKVQKIKYKYHLQMDVDADKLTKPLSFDRYMEGYFSYEECGTNQIDEMMKLELFDNAKQIIITANVIITNIYGVDEQEIPNETWNQYGLIVNNVYK